MFFHEYTVCSSKALKHCPKRCHLHWRTISTTRYFYNDKHSESSVEVKKPDSPTTSGKDAVSDSKKTDAPVLEVDEEDLYKYIYTFIYLSKSQFKNFQVISWWINEEYRNCVNVIYHHDSDTIILDDITISLKNLESLYFLFHFKGLYSICLNANES